MARGHSVSEASCLGGHLPSSWPLEKLSVHHVPQAAPAPKSPIDVILRRTLALQAPTLDLFLSQQSDRVFQNKTPTHAALPLFHPLLPESVCLSAAQYLLPGLSFSTGHSRQAFAVSPRPRLPGELSPEPLHLTVRLPASSRLRYSLNNTPLQLSATFYTEIPIPLRWAYLAIRAGLAPAPRPTGKPPCYNPHVTDGQRDEVTCSR